MNTKNRKLDMLHRSLHGSHCLPILFMSILTLFGCSKPTRTTEINKLESRRNAGEPDEIIVQYILIPFLRPYPRVPTTTAVAESKWEMLPQNQGEALKLAKSIVAEARGSVDFDDLVSAHSFDQNEGPITVLNYGLEPPEDTGLGEVRYAKRAELVTGFGDTAFSMRAGTVKICRYDLDKNQLGFFVIKRID